MKRIQSGWIALLFFAASAIFANKSYAQNWNPQQKDIWANVEAYWALQAKGDVDGFMSYFSPDYMGWDYGTPVPEGKSIVAKYMANGLKNGKTDFYNIVPVAILIYGDIAIVDYYYNIQRENMEGKKSWEHGRWTDILQKQSNGGSTKWVLIADHGGDVKDKE